MVALILLCFQQRNKGRRDSAARSSGRYHLPTGISPEVDPEERGRKELHVAAAGGRVVLVTPCVWGRCSNKVLKSEQRALQASTKLGKKWLFSDPYERMISVHFPPLTRTAVIPLSVRRSSAVSAQFCWTGWPDFPETSAEHRYRQAAKSLN